jgi:hypothetical protein
MMFSNCVLKVWEFCLVLLGHHVIAHFEMLRSISAHSQYLSSLFNWNWRDVKLLDIAARPAA